jgi:hypothetical protein
MQFHQFRLKSQHFFGFLVLLFCAGSLKAQVNTVEFGKNRLQFKNFKWQYYQTQNFNTYFSQGGQDLAKYVLQVAEKELPGLEKFVEYGLQRRANLVLYNTYNDMEQSNIGLNMDWQTTGGITKLVNNKMVLYYTDDHNALRIQIREGIARILVENMVNRRVYRICRGALEHYPGRSAQIGDAFRAIQEFLSVRLRKA